MRLQSAIFDLDGTLLDSMHMWEMVGVDMLRRQGYEPQADLHEVINVMTQREAAAYMKEAYRMPETVDEILGLINATAKEFYTNKVQAKPGVKKFLSLLKMEGVWMYVATNTDRRLVEIGMKHAGIDQYFRGIITCPEVGANKNDSPEVYERALTRLQSNKKDTVIFEDAIHGIRTAKKAGFRVCGVYDPSAEADQEEIRQLCDYYIRSFEEMFETKTLD